MNSLYFKEQQGSRFVQIYIEKWSIYNMRASVSLEPCIFLDIYICIYLYDVQADCCWVWLAAQCVPNDDEQVPKKGKKKPQNVFDLKGGRRTLQEKPACIFTYMKD